MYSFRTSTFKINFVQQCIQISTRINSSSVHTYISSFVLHCVYPAPIQYSTWCQNRGCSYISSTRRIYSSNPAVSCIFPSILNISTVELQFYYSKKGRKTASSAKCHCVQGLQSSSTRQNLHSKRQQGSPGFPCFIPCSSRASKHHPVPPNILPGRNFILCGLR